MSIVYLERFPARRGTWVLYYADDKSVVRKGAVVLGDPPLMPLGYAIEWGQKLATEYSDTAPEIVLEGAPGVGVSTHPSMTYLRGGGLDMGDSAALAKVARFPTVTDARIAANGANVFKVATRWQGGWVVGDELPQTTDAPARLRLLADVATRRFVELVWVPISRRVLPLEWPPEEESC